MILDEEYIKNLLEYIKSGNLAEDFEYSAEERRYEILDFLEHLMELGEAADEAATGIIFKNTQLKDLNPGLQKPSDPDG
ncbi:MAG: hypothetical protein K9K64_02640 [Desulfohalobiaceae bacterium]|nr:hypothetical protein [Desulfohalobiaceae bacterium]